ncbi:hypothetical protein FB99_05730 [Pantoea agglomerans]|nr:hypothetical protein FB99_05730 [Pantoea agglomerans]
MRQFRHDRSPVSVYRRGRTSRVSSEKSPSENLTSQAREYHCFLPGALSDALKSRNQCAGAGF